MATVNVGIGHNNNFIITEFAYIKIFTDSRAKSHNKMKEIIAINGSSPAFIYLFAKAFVDYAEKEGIAKETALPLFAQSLIGSARMLTDSGYSIEELIRMVSSPGGTTLAGLDQLYAGGLEATVDAACTACTKRAYELSR